MQTITALGIDYLSTLDYIDLTNLCKTNRQFATICTDNTYLRRILYNTNKTIYIPPKFDIALAMKQLDDEVETLFFKNYPSQQQYPRWINKELFTTHMKKVIYCDIYNELNSFITAEIDYTDYSFVIPAEDLFKDNITLELVKPFIAFPFAAYPVLDYGDDYNFRNISLLRDVENTIVLPKHFVDYIKYAILDWDAKGLVNKIDDGLADLLFLKPYTFREYWMEY